MTDELSAGAVALRQFFHGLASLLIEQPEHLSIAAREENGFVYFQVSAEAADAQQLVGPKSATLRSLSSLLFAAAARHGLRLGFQGIEVRAKSYGLR